MENKFKKYFVKKYGEKKIDLMVKLNFTTTLEHISGMILTEFYYRICCFINQTFKVWLLIAFKFTQNRIFDFCKFTQIKFNVIKKCDRF